MRNEYAFIIPFNRCDLHKKGAWRYKKTLARPEWWKKRAKILKEYTLKSLKNQKSQIFSIWGLFLKQDMVNAKPVIDVLNSHNAHIAWGSNNETLLEGCEEVLAHYHNKCKNLVMIHLDSDDMYASNTISFLRKQEITPGSVFYYSSGYIYGVFDRRLATFDAPKAPPPFVAMVFPNEVLKSYDAWLKFRTRFKMNCYHHQVHHCKKRKKMPHGFYCYMMHDENVVSAWSNKHTYTKIGKFIRERPKKVKILNRFGIDYERVRHEGMEISNKSVQQPQVPIPYGEVMEYPCRRDSYSCNRNCGSD